MKGFKTHHFLMTAGIAVLAVAGFKTLGNSGIGRKIPGVAQVARAL